ncbi:MAG: type III pantothenate kinase [Thermotogaceae bacterium]|nr:type III pantothenate kinase [Thermotogaceae bacterium]
MNLYIDVGNTHTVFGVKINNKFLRWRLATGRYETEDEIFSNIKPLFESKDIDFANIESVVISSVVPSLDYIFKRFAEKFFNIEPLFVVADDKCEVKWPVEDPKEIGADRVANVIGAFYEYGKNAIVIDCGTAITVDVLHKGEFLGGSITPGILTMLYSLFKNAAKLPLINLDEVPKSSIGKNTADNIKIGILKVLAYGLNQVVEDIKNELSADMKVIVTGGQSKIILPILKYGIYDPDITLKGMEWYRRFHEKN